MSLLDGLADLLGYTKTQPVGNPVAWQRAQATGAEWELPPLTMPEAQADLYKRLSWVQIAIGNVASVAATTKLSVKRLEGEDEVDIPNHPFEILLDRPNPLMSRYELLEALTGFRLLTGQAFLWLNRTSNAVAPSEMWVIPTSQIEPVPDENLYLRGYMYDAGNGTAPIPLDLHEIVHFKRWNPANPFVGLSGIEALATVAVGDLSMQKWNTNFFSKDHAKPPGALAFADPIADSDWDRLKDDINRQHGGVQRRMMMLRNAGKGGVEWINMAVSQKDMEFLSSRTFNRAEIFGMLAPGLDSILAINATEANATAGKSTFIDFAVWPGLVSMAEKITNDILPAYGPNLRAEFDDIRVTDKAMELQEQSAFATVATIDEIRQRYYQLEPLGDARGALLVAEITAGKANQPELAQRPISGAIGQPMQVAAQAQSDAGTPTETPTGNAGNLPDQTAKAEDLARFKRWAAKRSKPDPDAFTSEHLTFADKAAVLWEMKAGDAEPIKAHSHADHSHHPIKALQVGDETIDPILTKYETDLGDEVERAITGETDKPEFEDTAKKIILAAILLAFLRGVGKETEEELTSIERVQLRARRNAANEAIANLSGDIYNQDRYTPTDRNRVQTEAQGVERARGRVLMWVSTLAGTYAAAQLFRRNAAGESPRYAWVLGQTSVHCADCLRLSNQVHTAEEWQASGYHPQGRNLECGGWRCDCRFDETTDPARGAF